MMNIKFKSILLSSLAAIAGMMAVSCDTEKPAPDNGQEVDDKGNTYVTTDCITPIRYVDGSYVGSTTGVSVSISQISSNNIQFVCEPGTDINSFLVQVYPMGTLYNTLLEAMHAEGKQSLTVEETSNYIAQAISLKDEEGVSSGGVLYARESHGDDFNSVEIDLASSSIVPYPIMPGVEYLVVVQACFDDAATRLGDMAICHVEATPKEASDDVKVDVALEASINSVGVTLTPGAGCAYISYIGNTRAQIDEYVNAYGDEMFHDLLCHTYATPISISDMNLQFRISDIEPESEYCFAAVAFASDFTPAARITRQDCTLKDVPDDAPDGECEFKAPSAYAATIAKFDVVLGANCYAAYYQLLTKAEAEAAMALEGTEREAKVLEIRNGGWGVTRPSSVPVGSVYTYPDLQNELTPETEYAFLYVTRNEYGQTSDLQLSETTFTTKKLVRDQPGESIEDAYMEIVDATRSALTLKFTYSSDKTALIMHRNAFPIIPNNGYDFPEVISDDYRYDKDPGDGKGWLYWFLDFRHNDPYQTRWPDFVNALAIPSLDPIKVSGYSPKTTYQFAYIAEDVNGVLGHVKTCSGTTLSNEGGSNPQIEKIEYSTASTGEVAFTFYANDDITTIYYMVATYQGGAGPAASDLRLDRLLDKNSSDYTGIKNAWQRTVLGEQGLSTSTNIQPRVTIPALDSELTVAIAYAYGTNDTESALATLIIDGEGNEYTLEEWYGMTVQYVTVPRY